MSYIDVGLIRVCHYGLHVREARHERRHERCVLARICYTSRLVYSGGCRDEQSERLRVLLQVLQPIDGRVGRVLQRWAPQTASGYRRSNDLALPPLAWSLLLSLGKRHGTTPCTIKVRCQDSCSAAGPFHRAHVNVHVPAL